MVVCTSGDELESLRKKGFCQRLGIPDDLMLVLGKLRLHRLTEADRFPCDHMFQGSALCARENSAVHLFRELLFTKDQSASRSAKRLVCSGRNDIRVRYRRGMITGHHQTCHMCHVHHAQRTVFVGHSADALEIDDPGIRTRSGHHQLRAFLLYEALQAVIIDQSGLRIGAVSDKVIEFSGCVYR